MTPVSATHRPAAVLVSERAIAQNVTHARAGLPSGTDLFAVVKADAYGHGLLRVARVAAASGANGFCVAVLDEALELREHGFLEPILVLGIVEPRWAALAAEQDIALAVGSVDWLKEAKLFVQKGDKPLRVHLAVDSGMGRIGFRETDEIMRASQLIEENADSFLVTGIFTHFATADSTDTDYFDMQVGRFKALLKALPTRPRYVHVANSATTLWHSACDCNMVRLGVAMYGLNPSGREIESVPYPLEPALGFESNLSFVKKVEAGEAISYGATYRAKQAEWIGTVPLGYADGWLRRLQGFHVLVDGQACEIVGRICMDQFMIRLPKKYTPGTRVTLVGRNGDAEITLQDVADYAATIHYEIACSISARIPRRSVHPLDGELG